MKARPFLAAVLAAAILLFGLGIGGWWLLLQRSPLALQQHPLSVPLAARFVPRNVPLSLHWLVSADQPAAYLRAVARPGERRRAAAAAERLRDGVFATAGLDYASELAPWLGEEISLALLTPPGPDHPPGWVLALRSRDPEGARRFLQRFWQTRSLAGTDLQISSYRGMGLISGRGALVGQHPQPIATALINDDLVLIASGRGALEQALDVSQIEDLNQAGSPQLQQAVHRLGKGVVLLTARPGGLGGWLGLPDPGAGLAPAPGAAPGAAPGPGAGEAAVEELVLALAPAGRGLELAGLLQLGQPLPLTPLRDGEPLLQQIALPVSSLALVQNPAALLAAESPWRPLATALLALALPPTAGPLPALVAGADGGPLLGARSDQGWLLGSRQDQPDPAGLAAPLAEAGYVPAPLLLKQRPLLVWSQLLSKPVKGNPDQLQARLAGARAQGPMAGADTGPGTGSDLAWWAEGLAVLETQLEGHHPPKERLRQLELLQSPQAPLQWAMDGATARSLLATWQPWRLLVALSGADGSLAESVRGAALSLEADPGAPASASRDRLLRLRGQLQFQG
ncbi:MAG: DUF3352 domain-containing protein [Synechococcales cyanobacterium SupBloom_Metag_052]|nr:DUF3352 domain-containing protein [Synechococcales cyanobacterium SupBloom_Metag_052]